MFDDDNLSIKHEIEHKIVKHRKRSLEEEYEIKKVVKLLEMFELYFY